MSAALPSVVIDAYRRILRAADHGRGVRLSAEEVEHIATFDNAVRQAVDTADEEAAEMADEDCDGAP